MQTQKHLRPLHSSYLKVDMSYNHIGKSGPVSLDESLKNMGHLKQLNLKCNKISDKGAI